MATSIPAAIRIRRRGRRSAGLVAAALLLITAPPATAANAANIDIQLPAGYTVAGTIRDSAGAVLPNATVVAIGTTSYGSDYTDAMGRYKLIGLKGSYMIQVQPPVLRNLIDGYYTAANANHYTGSAASATKVTAGPNKTGIDVRLPAGYTISGTLTTTSGVPLANASVGAVGPSSAGAATDAAGRYKIDRLRPGTYKLSVRGPYGTAYLRGWYSTANSNHFVVASASATSVTVGPNRTGVNVKVPTGYSISGKLTGTDGAPLAGLRVETSTSTTTTDASGDYTLKGLASGAYELQILTAPTSSYKDGYYTSANADHFTGAAASATAISVGPSRTGVDMKVAIGYSISGTIRDPSGMLLADVSVEADNLGHSRIGMTDTAGKYKIQGLTGGAQTLTIHAPESAPTLQQHGYYTLNNARRFTVVATNATKVSVGPSQTGINAKIPAGYSIAGKITGPGGAPASVLVQATSPYASAIVQTAPDGTYKIVGLPTGTYKVRAGPEFSGFLVNGWYTTSNSAHYTSSSASATGVTVGP